MQGGLAAWDDAQIPLYSEGFLRSASVFEGVKGYWRHDGSEFALLALQAHYERLCRSARLLHLPFEHSFDEFAGACSELVEALLVPERDLWLRPTVIATEGHWGLDTVTDLVITAYTLAQERPEPIDVGFSSWQRASDLVLPARIKSPANYQTGRLARIEGRRFGYSEMIMRNGYGRIAEATGACVVMVRDGQVITPPPSEGCLESITIDVIELMCAELEIPFLRRPVEYTELQIADELFLAGTLAELVPVRRVESFALPEESPVLAALSDCFWDVVRDVRQVDGVRLTSVPIKPA